LKAGPQIIAGAELKIWPGDLDQIREGKKRADVRRCDDRQFRVGQVWQLVPWDIEADCRLPLQGATIRITHVERMAGPLIIAGVGRRVHQAIPLAVLSFELIG
jgi:hypothetical protein